MTNNLEQREYMLAVEEFMKLKSSISFSFVENWDIASHANYSSNRFVTEIV